MKPGANSVVETIDGVQWKKMMRSGAQALARRRQEVDALNVFPVPDGDTGTNMHLTIQSAANDAEKTQSNRIADIAAAASMGSLMGARGNSGVILSQLMRGLAKGFEGVDQANAQQIAHALQMGVETAYKAVMKPVEGTILTVSREIAQGALSRAKKGGNPLETLKEGYKRGMEALARTPEMLPTLKQAGVVDAGGQGFLIILSGWIAVLEGQEIEDYPAEQPKAEVESVRSSEGITRIEDLEFPYCTEFLVKGEGLDTDTIRQDLMGRGDCLLVVGTEQVVKIHIHTKNPGAILEYAIQWGTLHEVAIHNMLEQNEAMAHAQKGEDFSQEAEQSAKPAPAKESGVVVVAMGDGIARVFESLGADEIVFGGQTMNPSTEDLVQAVERVNAKKVYILPNNGNVVMAARQVKDIVSDCEVHVVPSKSIPQGIAAMINYNPEASAEENLAQMEQALGSVTSGEITYAVRDSQYGDLEIKADDILGLVNDQIVTVGSDRLAVVQDTLEKMNWRDGDLITIFYGEDVSEEDVQTLEDWLRSEKPNVEVEIFPGNQPLYYYIIGVE